MRSGYWRGVTISFALAFAVVWAPTASAQFDFLDHFERNVPAVDYRTGDVMMAPPIPYGEYAKDYVGTVHEGIGLAAGAVHGLVGKICGLCGGPGCGLCHGLGHHKNGSSCGGCGGDGCGTCGHVGLLGGHGGGLFGGHGHGHGISGGDCTDCGRAGHGSGKGLLGGHGLFGGKSVGGGHGADGLALCGGPGHPCASPQGQATASAQMPSTQMPSSQGAMHPCGRCGGLGLIGARGCGLCGGGGLLGGLGGSCTGCGGRGLIGGSMCGGCGGRGLLSSLGGKCGGCGGLGHLGDGGLCGLCDGTGHCGLGKNTCGNCHGGGCSLCGGTGLIHHLAGLPHHLLGAVHGAAASVLHVGDIKYFVGPGGPVPITPGYVPYVVPTRSPREFFAFPPYSERAGP